jgi:hypothetical protein
MRMIAIAAVISALGAAPSFAEIVVPHLQPPPCSGNHCPFQARGARLPAFHGLAVQSAACPQGTVYNPRKGTCKVLPTPH